MAKNRTAKRTANGSGSIRKVERTINGKAYVYWQARYTAGVDPGTGKQIQKCVTGRTQREVAQKLREVTVDIDQGTYVEPSKMTLSQWLDIWLEEYLNSVKPRTAESYRSNCTGHIKPSLGAVRLCDLTPLDVQRFYNRLTSEKTGKQLSPKTKKNIHGTLHRALERAVKLGYLRANPADKPDLPKITHKEIVPLDDGQIADFMRVIHGHPYERVYLVTLFTGMREGEILGLTWDCVDFEKKQITISKQLQKKRGSNGVYELVSPKNGKTRVITPADYVLELLHRQRIAQNECRLAMGNCWSNPMNLVFTQEDGRNLCAQTVYLKFKALAAEAGVPDARFHDLRHSYAVAALRSGDDIKTVQANLGHHTAAFTLDVYGHVTEQMKQDSAERMERFIRKVSGNS